MADKILHILWRARLYLLLILAFTIYLKTCAPEVFTADCGEMVATSHVLGIPHPTGYPLYNQLNKLVSMIIPFGTISFRCALFSAIVTSVAIICFFQLLSLFFSIPSALIGAMFLTTSLTIWSQANIQEVYGLHLFYVTLLTYIGALYHKRSNGKLLLLFSFVSGLAVSHHLLSVFALPALSIFFFAKKDTSPRVMIQRFVWGIPFFILGWSNILYFPIRSKINCAIRWIPCHTFGELKYHITGQQFRTMMFNVTFESLSDNLLMYLEKLTNQTLSGLLIIALVGFYILFLRDKWFWSICTIMLLCVAAFFLTYRIVDIEVYYIQSYIPFFIFMTAGFEYILSNPVTKRFRSVRAGLILLIICAFGCSLVKAFYFNDRSRGWVAYDWGKSIYDTCPVDSVLVTQGWSSPFVFFYLDHVEGYRPDILMHVDYKGAVYARCLNEDWDVPLISTVPVEIPSVDRSHFRVSGGAYLFSNSAGKRLTAAKDGFHRDRSFHDPTIFLDYHGLGFKAKKLMMMGEKCFETGDRRCGFEYLSQSEAVGRENPLTLSNLSAVSFQQREYESSERLARMAIALDPGFYPAYHNLGNALMKLERYDEALEAFLEVDDSSHALGRQREALGFAYLQQHDCHKAIEEFRRAIDILPTSLSARIGRGAAYNRCREFQLAKNEFQWVLDRDPTHFEAGINLALAHIHLEEFEEAECLLENLKKSYPEAIEPIINLAVIYGETGRLVLGRQILEKLYLKNQQSVTLLNNLALLCYLSSDLESAETYWRRSLSKDPKQEHIRKNIIRMKLDKSLLNSVD